VAGELFWRWRLLVALAPQQALNLPASISQWQSYDAWIFLPAEMFSQSSEPAQ
jgi:hypothetical protein